MPSSRPEAAHFAAAVERPPYFALAFAFAFAGTSYPAPGTSPTPNRHILSNYIDPGTESPTENPKMKRFAIISATTAVAWTLIACSSQPADTHAADVKAIQDNENQWNQDFAAKDTSKILAHYADDAVLMTPDMPASHGITDVSAAIKQMVADPALALKFQSSKIEVAKSGDIGYTQGIYTMIMTDPVSKQIIHDHGSYVTTYRKQPDGTWKAVADIATSEVPPPAPPPAGGKRGKSSGKNSNKSSSKTKSKHKSSGVPA